MNETFMHTRTTDSISIVWVSMGIGIALGNILCIAVCRKALKKTFHRLVVMALCFSNIFTISGSSVIVFTSFFEFHNTGACTFHYLLSCFGIVLNYSLIFLLCLQRYLTVKSFNFRTVERFDYKKYQWIGGTIVIVFLYTLSCVLFITRDKELSECSRHALYGDNVAVFVVSMFGPVAILIIAVMCISILTSYKICKIYYIRRENWSKLRSFAYNKKNIFPAKANVSDTYKVEPTGSGITINQKGIVNRVKIFKNRSKVADLNKYENYTTEKDDQHAKRTKTKSGEVSYKNNELDVENRGASFFVIQQDISSHKTSMTDFSVEKSPTATCFQDTFQVNAIEEQNGTREMQISTIEIKDNLSEKDEAKDVAKPRVSWQRTVRPDYVAKHKQSWEIHAFKTSLIISVQTLILTGPLVVAYWIEIITGQRLTEQVNGIVGLPFLVHAFTNPFIYAWRIPDMRREFKKMCNRNH